MNTQSAAAELRAKAGTTTVDPGTSQLIRDVGTAVSNESAGLSSHVLFTELARGSSGTFRVLCEVLAAMTRFGNTLALIIIALGFYQAVQTGSAALEKGLSMMQQVGKWLFNQSIPGAGAVAQLSSWGLSMFKRDADMFDATTDSQTLASLLPMVQPDLPIAFQLLLTSVGSASAPAPRPVTTASFSPPRTGANPWSTLFTNVVSPLLGVSDEMDATQGQETAARVYQAAIDCGADPATLAEALQARATDGAQADYLGGAR